MRVTRIVSNKQVRQYVDDHYPNAFWTWIRREYDGPQQVMIMRYEKSGELIEHDPIFVSQEEIKSQEDIVLYESLKTHPRVSIKARENHLNIIFLDYEHSHSRWIEVNIDYVKGKFQLLGAEVKSRSY